MKLSNKNLITILILIIVVCLLDCLTRKQSMRELYHNYISYHYPYWYYYYYNNPNKFYAKLRKCNGVWPYGNYHSDIYLYK